MPSDERDPAAQLRRYADAFDRAAEVGTALPAELAPRPLPHHRLLLAVAATLAVIGLATSFVVAGDDDPERDELTAADPDRSTSTSPATLAAGGLIEGDDGCAVEVLPGPDDLVAGPAPEGVSFLQGAAAHLTTDDDLLAEVHVPGDAMTDVLGEDTDQIEITAGTATLWRGAVAPGDHRFGDFSEVRYFPGNEDRCRSFTVTTAGGTEAENDALAIRIANRLRPTDGPIAADPTPTTVTPSDGVDRPSPTLERAAWKSIDVTGPTSSGIGVPAIALPTTTPPPDLAAVRAEVEAIAISNPGHFVSWGGDRGNNSVAVELAAGREPLGAALVDRYGSLVEVEVAGLPWPRPAEGWSTRCSSRQPLNRDRIKGVDTRIDLTSSTMPLGSGFGGTVTVTNHSSEAIELSNSPNVTATLADAHGRSVGYYELLVAQPGMGTTLQPGAQSRPIPIRAGIAACDPSRGTALQPGTYGLVVTVDVVGIGQMTLEPIIVTITAP